MIYKCFYAFNGVSPEAGQASLDALPAIKGKRGRPRRWPEKLYALNYVCYAAYILLHAGISH